MARLDPPVAHLAAANVHLVTADHAGLRWGKVFLIVGEGLPDIGRRPAPAEARRRSQGRRPAAPPLRPGRPARAPAAARAARTPHLPCGPAASDCGWAGPWRTARPAACPLDAAPRPWRPAPGRGLSAAGCPPAAAPPHQRAGRARPPPPGTGPPPPRPARAATPPSGAAGQLAPPAAAVIAARTIHPDQGSQRPAIPIPPSNPWSTRLFTHKP